MTSKKEEMMEQGNPAVDLNEKVTVHLFKDNQKYKDDVFVAVNGRGWLLQRGVDVQVPRYVAQVLQQSKEQDTQAALLMEQAAGAWKLAAQ